MNSGNVFERLWKLETSARELVLEGKRDAEVLSELLQKFVFGTDFNWAKVYEVLGMSKEYSEFVKAHEAKANPDLWIIPVLKGVTCNKVVQVLRGLNVKFNLYADDLDKAVPENDRDPNRDDSYLIGFAKNVEADEENKSKSANKLAEGNHKGITLLERLMLELAYFLATKQHLDVKNITLCTGSRDSDGYVPRVYWDADHAGVFVDWYSPDYAFGVLRSRSAVS